MRVTNNLHKFNNQTINKRTDLGSRNNNYATTTPSFNGWSDLFKRKPLTPMEEAAKLISRGRKLIYEDGETTPKKVEKGVKLYLKASTVLTDQWQKVGVDGHKLYVKAQRTIAACTNGNALPFYRATFNNLTRFDSPLCYDRKTIIDLWSDVFDLGDMACQGRNSENAVEWYSLAKDIAGYISRNSSKLGYKAVDSKGASLVGFCDERLQALDASRQPSTILSR